MKMKWWWWWWWRHQRADHVPVAQPVLHLDGRRIQKHRIDAEALRAVLNEWGAAREAEAAVAEVAVDGSDADRTSAAERKVPSP